FFDVSAIIFMFVLAYLSNRLGEALKIPPFYKMLYVTAVMVITASMLDVVSGILPAPLLVTIALFIRFLAGIVSYTIVMRYWVWVFSEFFKQ
ncbi:MAG: hypothetical protein JXA18_17730, partial [Chitinispirillaceae bacterium]|nr:hypothetical protein [Chitinispirillaceae bacterium]